MSNLNDIFFTPAANQELTYDQVKNAFFGIPTTSPVYYAGAIGAIILLFILVEAAFRKEMGKEG